MVAINLGRCSSRHSSNIVVPGPVSRFVKYTGYGNAAGLLVTRGLLAGGRGSGFYSGDEDSDTEEYREAKTQ